MKKIRILLMVLSLVIPSLASAFEIHWDDSTAKVGYILQRDYQKTLLRLVHQAKKSITIVMYTIDYTKRGEESVVVELINDLINAKKRGVRVRVILENTVLINTRAYKSLLDNGIEVYWDNDVQVTHAKVVVIDNRLVIIGSSNWTDRAFRTTRPMS